MTTITPTGYELRYYRIAFKKQVWKWLERYTSDFKKVHQRGCYYHPENGEDISDHVDIDIKNKDGSSDPTLIKCTTSGTPFTIVLSGGNYKDNVTGDLNHLKEQARHQITSTWGWENLNFNELVQWFACGREEGLMQFKESAKAVAGESFDHIINHTLNGEIQHINEKLQDVVLKDLHQTVEPGKPKDFEVFQTNVRIDVDYGMITTEYLIRWHRVHQRIEFDPSGKKLTYW